MSETIYLGIDLGTSRTSITCSNGTRETVWSYVGYPKDHVAMKALGGRSVIYGKEAVELLLDYLSQSLGIAQVSLDVREDNFRAHRLYESVGFRNEGYVSEVGSAHGQASNTRIYHYTWEPNRDMSQESD